VFSPDGKADLRVDSSGTHDVYNVLVHQRGRAIER
jgi:hypothetical protein